MHTGKQYSVIEVIFWTRRDIISLMIVATIPTICYVVLGWKWLAIPWLPIALLGTAVAFVVGFKNNASYDRMWEARRTWGSITNLSRSWGLMINDFITTKHSKMPLNTPEIEAIKLQFIQRHFAWLTALRFSLREPRVWEGIYKKHNKEYQNKFFKVEEQNNKLEDFLRKYLNESEFDSIINKTNKAAQILALQSAQLKHLLEQGLIEDFRHMELEKLLVELMNQQGACERIKNFPYPRQYATLNLYFIKIFVVLIPLGMIQEFEKLGGHMVWLSIPFSALSAWIFTTMEKIGESTESPFEGSANDVPITAISRSIEIDLKEMFEMPDKPEALKAENNILT